MGRLILFVIAHPDDESMFFGPSIRSLAKQISSSSSSSSALHLLCLTDGSYPPSDGATRCSELLRAAEILNVDPANVRVADLKRSKILDSPDRSLSWDPTVIARYLSSYITSHCDDSGPSSSITIVTFDERGVSSHPNHIDTYLAVRSYLETSPHAQSTTAYKLSSVSSLEKYCLPLHMLILFGSFVLCRDSVVCFGRFTSSPPPSSHSLSATIHSTVVNTVILLFSPLFFLPSLVSAWRSMAAHESQWVWYRKLFVMFSVYSYINVLDRIVVKPDDRRVGRAPPVARRPPSARKAPAHQTDTDDIADADAEARKKISAHVLDTGCSVEDQPACNGYLSERQAGIACMASGLVVGLLVSTLFLIKFSDFGGLVVASLLNEADPNCNTRENEFPGGVHLLSASYRLLKNDTYLYMAIPLSLVPLTLLYYVNWLGFKLFIRNGCF